jgi:hypothetical protein
MRQLRTIISESTGISISLLITLAGGIFWLSTLYAKTLNTEQATQRIESKQDQYNKDIQEIKEDIAHIKGMLENK